MLGPSFAALVVLIATLATAQLPPTPSSWPQDYPGKPSGNFSPEWQSCGHNLRCRFQSYYTHLRSCFRVPRLPGNGRVAERNVDATPQLCREHSRKPRRPCQQHAVLLGIRARERFPHRRRRRACRRPVGHLAERRVSDGSLQSHRGTENVPLTCFLSRYF